MKSDRKPPLVKSPLRLRPRRVIRSSATPMRTPLPASSTKIRMQNQASKLQEYGGIRPEYRTISCEINALERMVQEELGKSRSNGLGLGGFSAGGPGSAFQRGRFYDEYSARRNERLKRKMSSGAADENEEPKTIYNPMVYSRVMEAESAKKEETKKRATAKKSIQQTTAASQFGDRSEHPRYSLRSMKKPPLPVPMSVENSAMVGERKTRPLRARGN